MSVTAKRTVAKQVEERAKAGICLIDNCGGEARRRGLCDRHYTQFVRRQLSRGDEKAQLDFEENAIREGLVLASHAIREIKTTDPFAEC